MWRCLKVKLGLQWNYDCWTKKDDDISRIRRHLIYTFKNDMDEIKMSLFYTLYIRTDCILANQRIQCNKLDTAWVSYRCIQSKIYFCDIQLLGRILILLKQEIFCIKFIDFMRFLLHRSILLHLKTNEFNCLMKWFRMTFWYENWNVSLKVVALCIFFYSLRIFYFCSYLYM